MWIERDLAYFFGLQRTLESILIQGPRQVGKSSFLERYAPGNPSLALLDDLALRQLAQRDPALFLSQLSGPVIIDEVHYAPNLLPEIKLRIDAERRRRREAPSPTVNVDPMFFLSGSNQIDIDRAVKETLAGRLSIFTMHGLSVAEALAFDPNLSTWDCLWRGGFPELHVRRELSPITYINDYISTFIEKDIARSGGVSKLEEFLTVTRLLAARVGNILNRDSVANDAGVASKTVGEWSDVLKRTHIIYLLPPFSSNLNSRLIKSPKVYFLDVGLAARLQGHLSRDAMIGSPQIGALFENLVVSEIIKTRAHRGLSYEVAFWRTRDGDEVDIVLSWPGKVLLVEAKLAIQGDVTFFPPSSVVNEFGPDVESLLVTFSGTQTRVTPHTTRLPISALADYLTMIDRMSLGLP